MPWVITVTSVRSGISHELLHPGMSVSDGGFDGHTVALMEFKVVITAFLLGCLIALHNKNI